MKRFYNVFGSLTNPVVESNDKTKSTFPLVTFAFILTLATGFVKNVVFLKENFVIN